MSKRRIIDKRKKEKYMLDDEYLNGMARLCGWQGTIVYNSLCRHSNKEQECFPSIKLMAEQHGVSRPTILKGLEKLEDRNVIKIETKRTNSGKQANNTYILIDKSEWQYKEAEKNKRGGHLKSDRVNLIDSDSRVNKNTTPSKQEYTSRVNLIYCKETHKQGNTYKETHTSEDTSQEEIVSIIDLFKELEISAAAKRWYANTTQRKAVTNLIKEFGFENVQSVVRLLPKTNKQQYMPKVTTPHQLEEKWYQLRDALVTKKQNLQDTKPKMI